jgi:hypothetical protein
MKTCDKHQADGAIVQLATDTTPCPLCAVTTMLDAVLENSDRIKHEATVTATVGESLFAPVQFHSFRHGPFTITGRVRPDETPEEAFERLYKVAVASARKAFPLAKDLFWDLYEDRFKNEK